MAHSASSTQEAWLRGEIPTVRLHHPCPSSAHRDDEALPAGPNRLAATMLRFMTRAGEPQMAALLLWLSTLPVMTMGTFCSGTDILVDVVSAFASVLKEAWAFIFLWEHLFSSELDHRKRHFLHVRFPQLRNLFGDCSNMWRGRCIDALTKAVVVVVGVSFFYRWLSMH